MPLCCHPAPVADCLPETQAGRHLRISPRVDGYPPARLHKIPGEPEHVDWIEGDQQEGHDRSRAAADLEAKFAHGSQAAEQDDAAHDGGCEGVGSAGESDGQETRRDEPDKAQLEEPIEFAGRRF